MKRNKICLKMSLIAAGIFLCSTVAYAAPPYYSSSKGAALTVGHDSKTTPTGADSAVLTFNPSPGVSMGVNTTDGTVYYLNALNTRITKGMRNEYLVFSKKAGYYQQQIDAITSLSAATITALAPPVITAYTYMGGS